MTLDSFPKGVFPSTTNCEIGNAPNESHHVLPQLNILGDRTMNQEILQIGVIPTTKAAEILFYIDTYNGDRFANIRRFIKAKRYTGPTRAGIKVNVDLLHWLIECLNDLPDFHASEEPLELGRHPKGANELIVVVDRFQGQLGINIREWKESKTYTGWLRKGLRVDWSYRTELKELCIKMWQAMQQGGSEKIDESAGKISLSRKGIPQDNSDEKNLDKNFPDDLPAGIPRKYSNFF